MEFQAAAVLVIRLFTEQIEHLGVGHADQEIEAGICIRHDQEQGCTLISNGVQMELIIGSDFPKLLNIKYSQPCAAAHQD